MKEMSSEWHLRVFRKSLLKQAKLNAIRAFLPDLEGKVCLDLGGDNGIISYFLREGGGIWHSADLSDHAVGSIRALVHTNVFKTGGSALPFPDGSLDLVVIIDFLEHIPHDQEFIHELGRVMKKSGLLIINVPYLKKRSVIRWVKKTLGLSDERHGHLRPGYTMGGLASLLGGRFTIVAQRTYSRFFTELLDVIINLGYGTSAEDTAQPGKGLLLTENELKNKRRTFRMYSLLYPFIWCFSALDILLFFTDGHKLILKAIRSEAF